MSLEQRQFVNSCLHHKVRPQWSRLGMSRNSGALFERAAQ